MHPGQDPSLPPVNLPTIPSACILPFPPGHATPIPNLRSPEYYTDIPLQVTPGSPGLPEQGIPGQGIPGQGTPGQGIPGQEIPGQEIPVQGIPGQGIPGQGIPGQGIPGQGIPGQGIPESRPPEPSMIPGSLPPDGIPTEPTPHTPKPREARLDKVVFTHRPNRDGVGNTILQFKICNMNHDCCESRNFFGGTGARAFRYWFGPYTQEGNCEGFRIDYPAIPTILSSFAQSKTWILPCVEFWMKDNQTQLVCEDLELPNGKEIPKNNCHWIISPNPTCDYGH